MASHSFSALGLIAVLGLGAHGAAQTPYTAAPQEAEPGRSAQDAGLIAPQSPAPQDKAAQQPPRSLSTLWDGALVDSANGTDFSETDGYRKLLVSLQHMSDAEAASRTPVDLNADDYAAYDRIMKSPDEMRGEWVRARVLIVQVGAERLDHPLDGAVDVWRGWGSDPSSKYPIAFDVLDRPAGLELERDLVDVEGILYRTVRYEPKKGAVSEVPWILARRVTRVDQSKLERHGVADVWAIVLIGLAVAFIVMRLVQIARQQKRGETRHLSDHSAAIRKAAAIPRHRPPAPPDPTSPTPTTPTPPDSP